MKIKPFKQIKGYCGPACIKMIMDSCDIVKSENTWAKLTKTSRLKGCSEKEIVRIAESMGFYSYVQQRSSINELKRLLAKGRFIIVDWFSPEEGGHYSVVVKIDKANIWLADPHFSKIKKHSINWFEERWFDCPFKNLVKKEMIVISRK